MKELIRELSAQEISLVAGGDVSGATGDLGSNIEQISLKVATAADALVDVIPILGYGLGNILGSLTGK